MKALDEDQPAVEAKAETAITIEDQAGEEAVPGEVVEPAVDGGRERVVSPINGGN